MSLNSHQEIQILHVDDDPSITDLTGTFLERDDERFTVETATSADEGLENITDSPPDCVVSDYNMPGTDGIEFLQAVREEYPDLPFILFTGKGSETVASDAIAAGVTDYLQKESGTEQYELLANRIRNAVHARREAERADRQEQLMRLTEFLGDTGGFEFDRENNTILLTAGARRVIGRPDTFEITLEEALELFHPDDREGIQQTLDRAFETGEQLHHRWRLQPDDGNERFLDITVTPVVENGEVTKLRGAGHDITDRTERQRKLTQIETLFQRAQDSLFLINAGEEFTVERVNPAWEDAMGMSAEQVQHKTLRDVLGEQSGAVSEKFRECIQRQEPLQYEETTQVDAELIQWETRIAPVVVDETVEYIAGSTRDITEQKERQQELRRNERAMDEAPVGIALSDPSQDDNPLTYVNDRFQEVTGYDEDETIGRNCRWLQGEDTREEPVAQMREAIDANEPVTVELRNYRKDGTEFWNRVSIAPVYDDQGSVVNFLRFQQDITDRKERERELREKQRFIEQALDTLDDLFYVFNVDGSLRRWNNRVVEVTGYTDSELDGKQVIEMFPEDEHSTVANAVQMAVTGEKATVEADLLAADGQRVPYEFTGARLTDETGEITGIVGIGRDLTERQQRDQRIQYLQTLANELAQFSIDFLRTEERDIDTLINATLEKVGTLVDADRTYIFDVDHEAETLSNTYEWCSKDVEPQIDTLQNLPQETLPWWTQKLKNFDNIIIPKVPELPPEAEAEQELLQEQNIESLIVTPMISNDKLVGFVGFDWVEEQDVWSDEFINILCMVNELITTARRRKEREQELRELTRQYETLVRNFPDGAVYLIDTNLKCVRAGGDELSNVGLSLDDIEGTTPHDLFPAEIANELCHYYHEAFDGTASAFQQEYEGEQYRIQTVPVRIDGEEINYVMAVAQNVSERVENKRTLERQNERLEEFASIISHDLRNPLRVANGRLELIREECESDHIDDVGQALDRMDTLIEDLLTLAREGEQVGETEPVGLADVAKTSWQTVNTEQATLETDTTQAIQADRSRLQQLFENLYRNAVEHGGDDVTVSVGVIDDGFYVADTGPGIPESDREEVFEAGYSTNEDGTGFGLRIVEQIADAHGWEIIVTESKGGGARFEITGVETGE